MTPLRKISGLLLAAVLVIGPAWAQSGLEAGAPPPIPHVHLPQWVFLPGLHNDITDVPGVRVGHVTITRDAPAHLRTGVTAIIPHDGDMAQTGLWAAGRWINGNGELTGLGPLGENGSGVLNSPILLTNTFSVSAAQRGVFDWYRDHYPGKTRGSTVWPGQLPVVGECWDGVFSAIQTPDAVLPLHAVLALDAVQDGPITQGTVGAGTGMRSFGLHAGIGSASRRITLDGKAYTIGVLVNANHSHFEHLNPAIRTAMEAILGTSLEKLHQRDDADRLPWVATEEALQAPRQGSIIVIIATDLPLNPRQLGLLIERAALGIGATGSTMDTTSGDGVVVFSTAQKLPLGDKAPALLPDAPTVHPDALTPVFRATAEAVTEAQINALLAAHAGTLRHH